MKRISFIISLIFFAVNAVASPAADTLLKNAADKYGRSKSINATYRVSSDDNSMSGKIVVAGQKFVIDSPQIKSWFDGKTQWTYSPEIGEVNIVEPSDEELAQINPFAIIQSFRKDFRAKTIASDSSSETIELTPVKAANNIRRVRITLDKRTLFPSKIVIYQSGSSPLTINVSSVTDGMELPDTYFKFNPTAYKGVEIIDLR